MEARISHHIQGIFMLNRKTIPPTLNKHLTNVSLYLFIKINLVPIYFYLLILNVHNILENI